MFNCKTMKRIDFKNRLCVFSLSALCLVIIFISSCKQEKYPIITNPQLNITGYIDSNPDLSLFDQILVKTGYAGYLGAYGGYTVFAPNNAAVTAWLKTVGKTSVDQVDLTTLQNMANYHIINDTISTSFFTDGKLRSPTVYGQFLVTGAINVNGATSYSVNHSALITTPNIELGNGIVHVINQVLVYASQTITQSIAGNSKYTIFSQALTATGLADTLNMSTTTRPFLTLIAETDSVLAIAGIHSFTDLKNAYSNTGNPLRNPNDGLYTYMAYHIWPQIDYLGDIVSANSHNTLAANEICASTLINTQVVLDHIVINGVVSQVGVPLDKTTSDWTASNGVIQNAKQDYNFKVYPAVRVDFDFCAQPELEALSSIYQKNGQSITLYKNSLAGVYWDVDMPSSAPIQCNYFCEATTSANYYEHYDGMVTFARLATGYPSYIEYKLPFLAAGTYKAWYCYRKLAAGNGGKYLQTSVDGVPMNRIWNMEANIPNTTIGTNSIDKINQSQGFKRYMYGTNGNMEAQLMGAFTITATGSFHIMRISCIKDEGKNAAVFTADMIQLIPVSMDQQWPEVRQDGARLPNPNPTGP